jgi:NCS2 family nucleobase:cation symporter-2
MFCALIGMAVGYAIAVATGLMSEREYAMISALPLVAIPSFQYSFAFSAALVVPFAIAGIASALKVIGVITMSQRVNNAEWVRPEMPSIGRGILADGLGNVGAGLIGAPLGLSAGAGSPGLIAATGVASAVIGAAIGLILIAVACVPPVAGILVLMPRAVLGAALLFIACFILVNGLQTITARMLDVRRTVMVGLAMSCGIAAETLPSFAAVFPPALQPLMGSSLVVGTAIALAFNAFFLIGLRKRAVVTLSPEEPQSAKKIDDFFIETGQRWGARKDVISRVIFGVNQAIETIRDHCEPQENITVTAVFDEFNVDVEITYRGASLEFPDRRPSEREIIENDAGLRRLAGYMLRRNADRVRADVKNENSRIQFHFDH